jgi:hypothetical protein
MAESKYGKYIVSELTTDQFDAEYNARYAQWATRVLWMDDRVFSNELLLVFTATSRKDARRKRTHPRLR